MRMQQDMRTSGITMSLGEKRRLKGQFSELLKYPQLAGTHFFVDANAAYEGLTQER